MLFDWAAAGLAMAIIGGLGFLIILAISADNNKWYWTNWITVPLFIIMFILGIGLHNGPNLSKTSEQGTTVPTD
jgi:hypothetical protein